LPEWSWSEWNPWNWEGFRGILTNDGQQPPQSLQALVKGNRSNSKANWVVSIPCEDLQTFQIKRDLKRGWDWAYNEKSPKQGVIGWVKDFINPCQSHFELSKVH
jgi:hypothetical protein